MLILQALFEVLTITVSQPTNDIQTIDIVDQDLNLVRITCHLSADIKKVTS